MTETNIPRLMTVREVARTGILPETAVRTGIKSGLIPHIRIGNRAYINYSKLLEILSECEAK